MPTILDVAKRAGVSKTLVSRLLNSRKGVSEASKEAILAAIKDLNYRPNHLARSLVLQRTYTIGVVMDSLCTPFYFDFICGLEDAGRRHGYNTLFCSANEQEAVKSRYIEFFTQGRTDGIIIYGSSLGDSDLIRGLSETHFPFVVVEHDIQGALMNRVLLDNIQGAKTATEHLISLGAKDIRHFMGDLNKKISLDRCTGFLEAMRAHGLQAGNNSIVNSRFTEKSGYECMKGLIEKKDIPEAIFFSGDVTAFGAMRAMIENGIRIPEDVRLVGFDEDTPGSFDLVFPALTTMKQPLHEMAEKAVQILVETIENPGGECKTKVFQPELLVKATCGASKI
ncbi:LacI family DNA-binding transcriptional regulator [Treponema sp.]